MGNDGPCLSDYINSGFVLIRCKGEHPEYNPIKDYKVAKHAIDRGFTTHGFTGMVEKEAEEWLLRGGWIGGLVPQGMIFIDSEIPHCLGVIEHICQAKRLSLPVMVTRRGKQYPFKVRHTLSGASKVFTRSGIEVTYRASGKNYVILPPAPGRHWENWQHQML